MFQAHSFAIFQFYSLGEHLMKHIVYALSLALLVMSFNLSLLAQDNKAQTEQFQKIAKLTQSKKDEDREKAFQMSKEFVKKYDKGTADEQVKKIKEFIDKYQFASFNKKLNEKKTAEAFAMGKEMLAQTPDDPYITMNLAYAGFDDFVNKKDKTFAADSIAYARQTLKYFEAGKLPKTFEPLKDQNEATALMYYTIGTLEVESALDDAVLNFYKAVQYESQFKTKVYPYYIFSFYYEQKYNKAAQDFTIKHGSKMAEDAAMKADNEKLEKILNNMLDAYARTVKFGEISKDPGTETWKKRFAEIYQFVNKSDTGAAEFLTNQPNKPLPEPSVN